MRVTIWGCRGSVATPGPETVEFGGNTSCVEVSLADGDRPRPRRRHRDQRARHRALRARCSQAQRAPHAPAPRSPGGASVLRAPLRRAGWRWTSGDRLSTVLSLEGTRQALLLASALSDRPSRSPRLEVRFRDVPREQWTIGGATSGRGPRHPSSAHRRLSGRDGRGRALRTCPIMSRRSSGFAERPLDWISGRCDRGEGRPARARRAVLRGRVPGESRLGALEHGGRGRLQARCRRAAPRPLPSRPAPY